MAAADTATRAVFPKRHELAAAPFNDFPHAQLIHCRSRLCQSNGMPALASDMGRLGEEASAISGCEPYIG
jgi:hypothetical protein